MQCLLFAAHERARQWRQDHFDLIDGVVIFYDGLLDRWLPDLPAAKDWAAGCVAVTSDNRVYIAHQVRGQLEWAHLGSSDSAA